MTSGLNTNFTLSPGYSFHKSSNHKSCFFFSLFIFRGHSTWEPASSRVTYFILQAYAGTGVSHSQHGKKIGRGFEKNAGEWIGRVEISKCGLLSTFHAAWRQKPSCWGIPLPKSSNLTLTFSFIVMCLTFIICTNIYLGSAVCNSWRLRAERYSTLPSGRIGTGRDREGRNGKKWRIRTLTTVAVWSWDWPWYNHLWQTKGTYLQPCLELGLAMM